MLEITETIMEINDLRVEPRLGANVSPRWAETPSRLDFATDSPSTPYITFTILTIKILSKAPKTNKPTVGFLV